jgi:hypothetical protein
MAYVRKALRASSNGKHFAHAMAVATAAMHGPVYQENNDGSRVRVWRDGAVEPVTKDDVRSWLLNLRVVDTQEGLEFVRASYIKLMIQIGELRRDARHSYYWITEKAAKRYDLPEVMGCEFPK